MRLIIKVIYIMELINIRNNKRVYVKDEDIVDGIYHFKYKIDFSQTPEKIQKDLVLRLATTYHTIRVLVTIFTDILIN